MRNIVIIAFAASLGCAAQTPGSSTSTDVDTRERTPSGFPTRYTLSKIVAQPIKAAKASDPQMEVASWKLEGPLFPDASTLAHPQGKPWEQLLIEKTTQKGPSAIADESMFCIAREVGQFYLTHKAYPERALRSFIVGRCAAPNASTRVHAVALEVSKGAKEDVLFASAKDAIAKLIEAAPTALPTSFGLWFGQKDKKAVFLLAEGERKLHLKAVEAGEAKNVVTLRGQVLVEASKLRAVITRGPYGFADCETGGAALPAFEVKCTADAKDPSASIEISIVPPGRTLVEPIASFVISPSGAANDAYARTDYLAGAKPANADELAAALFAAINKARTSAGVPALALDPGESKAAAALAPHYFSSVIGTTSATIAETIALGMRAGWDVEGLVQSGTFMSIGPAPLEAAGGLLVDAFERPSGREVFFDKRVEKIAIGAFWSAEERRVGAVIGSYALFAPMPEAEVKARVIEKLNAARTAAGKKPVESLRNLERILERNVPDALQGKTPAQEALYDMMKEASDSMKADVAGQIVQFRDLDSIELPKELIEPNKVTVGVWAGAERGGDEPWTRFSAWILFFGVGDKR